MKILSIFILILAISGSAYPFCHNGNTSITDEFEESIAVVIGKVVSVVEVPESENYSDGSIYTIVLQEVLKGDLSGTIEIFSENSSGRFPMDVGQVYILFVYMENRLLQVNNCGNSGLINESNDVLQTLYER
jgi:hypothetical protein